ncbi:MAG: hypothetical protein DDG58_04615 [Ardenticatenia bacterium]|nr:MAG: hypothetical protein DDG58_04615 [Ardenticatenia bacterium]
MLSIGLFQKNKDEKGSGAITLPIRCLNVQSVVQNTNHLLGRKAGGGFEWRFVMFILTQLHRLRTADIPDAHRQVQFGLISAHSLLGALLKSFNAMVMHRSQWMAAPFE